MSVGYVNPLAWIPVREIESEKSGRNAAWTNADKEIVGVTVVDGNVVPVFRLNETVSYDTVTHEFSRSHGTYASRNNVKDRAGTIGTEDGSDFIFYARSGDWLEVKNEHSRLVDGGFKSDWLPVHRDNHKISDNAFVRAWLRQEQARNAVEKGCEKEDAEHWLQGCNNRRCYICEYVSEYIEEIDVVEESNDSQEPQQSSINCSVGDSVKITDGPFASFDGVIKKIEGNEAIVEVELFGNKHETKLGVDSFEVVSK